MALQAARAKGYKDPIHATGIPFHGVETLLGFLMTEVEGRSG